MQQTTQRRQYLQIWHRQGPPNQVQVKWLREEEEKVMTPFGRGHILLFTHREVSCSCYRMISHLLSRTGVGASCKSGDYVNETRKWSLHMNILLFVTAGSVVTWNIYIGLLLLIYSLYKWAPWLLVQPLNVGEELDMQKIVLSSSTVATTVFSNFP